MTAKHAGAWTQLEERDAAECATPRHQRQLPRASSTRTAAIYCTACRVDDRQHGAVRARRGSHTWMFHANAVRAVAAVML